MNSVMVTCFVSDSMLLMDLKSGTQIKAKDYKFDKEDIVLQVPIEWISKIEKGGTILLKKPQ